MAKSSEMHRGLSAQFSQRSNSYLQRYREGIADYKSPYNSVKNLILFFKKPDIDGGSKYQGLETETKHFEEKVKNISWGTVFAEQGIILDARTIEKYSSNFASALEFVKDGYQKKASKRERRRRTGEMAHIHAERVMLRGVREMNTANNINHSLYATSQLARVLHDAKEDFGGFNIIPLEEEEKYSLSFNGQKKAYSLTLTPDEKELLIMQIGALSFTEDINKFGHLNPAEKWKLKKTKTKRQINHLIDGADAIAHRFGSLAAYYTLQAKIDDRKDNVFTTYPGKNSPNTKESYINKLNETKINFHSLEKTTKKYYEEATGRIYEDNHHSLIALCDELYHASGFNALLKPVISNILNEGSNSQLSYFDQLFLIPGQKEEIII